MTFLRILPDSNNSYYINVRVLVKTSRRVVAKNGTMRTGYTYNVLLYIYIIYLFYTYTYSVKLSFAASQRREIYYNILRWGKKYNIVFGVPITHIIYINVYYI